MRTNVLRLKRALRAALLVLLLSVAGMTKMYASYSFSAVCPTGQTLYYTIIDYNHHHVMITCPGPDNQTYCWYGFTKPMGNITIPGIVEYDGVNYVVTAIGDYAFYYCNGLTGSLTIPNSVTTIGHDAFNACYGLTGSLTLPSSLTTIGDGAFWYSPCTGDLTIPNSVTTIGDDAFRGCSAFTGNLTIGNSVTTIGAHAFCDCSGFTGSLTLPNSVMTIGSGAFSGCSGFTGSLTLSDSMTEIGQCAFQDCSGFTGSLIIPNTVTEIKYATFQNCSGFTGSLTIENSLTMIGLYAFEGCSGFTGDLIIPNSVTMIGGCAFQGCSGFTGNLTIPNSVTTIEGSAFRGCSGFTGNLTIPISLTIIDGNVFEDCSGFTGSLTIPNSVTTIYSCAFSGCSGFSGNLTIGSSVTTIGNLAFRGCSGFTSMTVLAEQPPTMLYGDAFSNGMSRYIPVYVPCGSLEAYQGANYWSLFNFIYDMCPHEISVTANPEEGGTVSGAGIYDHGTTATLTATPNEGYVFVNWTWDGFEISNEATYSFNVMEAGDYVANFSNNITQTSNFVTGWTWWSSYIELSDNSLEALQDGLGSSGEMIKSQNAGYASYLEGFGWYGSLAAINNQSTYQVKTNAACTLELTGNAANPEDHPITLSPGWTWVGYPVNASMSVEDALAGIEPQNGDMLKSQNDGYASYLAGYGWYGSLNTLNPGMGLMYKSNNSSAITLTYPNGGTRTDLKANQTTENNHWQPNLNAYPDNMSVMAVVELDGEELVPEPVEGPAQYELAAFANGECRGSAKLMYVEPLNRYMAFLTIAGDEAAELYFGLYNTETGAVETQDFASLQYETNAVVGSFAEPYVVSFRNTTGTDDWVNNLHVYPNPVERGQTVSFGFDDVETGEVRVEIINALGMVVETQCIASPQTIHAPNAAGVYTLRITMEGKGTGYRKLVVKE